MAFISQVSQRKTFRALVELALSGNQQAAKQVQELSGVLNQQDSNRIVVLHQIPRPQPIPKNEPNLANTNTPMEV
jgi:alpha-D-ribose 1-methylphosphonate 5-phosphate C-P lyase